MLTFCFLYILKVEVRVPHIDLKSNKYLERTATGIMNP